jgi:hypothetical protein
MLGTDYDTHNVLADFVFSLIMIRKQPASDLTFIPSFPIFKKNLTYVSSSGFECLFNSTVFLFTTTPETFPNVRDHHMI